MLPGIEAHYRYKAALRFDEIVEVTMRVLEVCEEDSHVWFSTRLPTRRETRGGRHDKMHCRGHAVESGLTSC
jgi:acyl-CoA thioesterase FadM